MKYKFTDDIIIDAVNNSKNYHQVCKYLGMKNSTGNSFERIKNRIIELKIDTSHFLGHKTYCGKNGFSYKNRLTATEILVKNQKNRLSHRILKRALLEIGVKYECNKCNLFEWLKSPITLDIDHIDGDWSNCDKDNLRFLCPNCHRQTDTYSGKNINKK